MNRFLHSIKKNKIGIVLMLFASLSTALGQMFWKLSDGQINLVLLSGFLLYFLGAVFMIVSFRFGSLSVLHPLLSIGYVFAIFLGIFFVGEHLSYKEFAGTILIMIGAVFIGGGDD